jgi:hypothetical protein
MHSVRTTPTSSITNNVNYFEYVYFCVFIAVLFYSLGLILLFANTDISSIFVLPKSNMDRREYKICCLHLKR